MPILGIGVGEYNITTGNQRSSGRRNQKVVKPQTMKIDQIIVHPEYASSESGNDIALIHLKEQIEWTDLIRPICLPDPLLLDADNEMATISGWGKLVEKKFSGSQQSAVPPKKQQLPILESNAQCQQWFNKASALKKKVNQGDLCAGFMEDDRKDLCVGDTGGSLMLADKNNQQVKILIGVISRSFGCSWRMKTPSIFTRVGNYMDWITSYIPVESSEAKPIDESVEIPPESQSEAVEVLPPESLDQPIEIPPQDETVEVLPESTSEAVEIPSPESQDQPIEIPPQDEPAEVLPEVAESTSYSE